MASSSASCHQQIEPVFKPDLYPAFGKLSIRKVTGAHILNISRSVERAGRDAGPVVASG